MFLTHSHYESLGQLTEVAEIHWLTKAVKPVLSSEAVDVASRLSVKHLLPSKRICGKRGISFCRTAK